MDFASRRHLATAFGLAIALFVSVPLSKAGVITWTNTSGGDWTNAANWNPNQVPLPTDTATLNINLAGPLTVPATDVLNWLGGTVSGPLIVSSNAVLNWDGELGGDLSGGSLTVAQGGTLTISNEVTFGYNAGNYQAVTNGGFLTNYGTVIQGAGTSIDGYGGSVIYNAGLWQAMAVNLGNPTELFNDYGTNTFINVGALQQIGPGTYMRIRWNFNNNGGTLGPANGAFDIYHWTGTNVVSGNGTIESSLSGTIAPGSVLTFFGNITSPVTVSSNAVLNWDVELGGDMSGGSLTVAQGGMLTISNNYTGLTFGYNGGNYQAVTNGGFLTNYGTVIQGAGTSIDGYGGSVIYNAGLWQVWSSSDFVNAYGTNIFINAGTLQQIGGNFDAVSIRWNFNNAGGTLGPASGTFSIYNWTGNNVVGGSGTIENSLSGTITSGSVFTFYGNITNPVTISSNAVLNWDGELGGDISGGSLTVAQGGTLTMSNGYTGFTFGYNRGNYQAVTNGGFLTNYGTVIEVDNGVEISGYGGSVIYNAGLWQVWYASDLVNAYGTNTFINVGTLRQVGMNAFMSTMTVNWNFNNGGDVVARVNGVVRFNGVYSDTSAANLSITLAGSNPNGVIQFAHPPVLLGTFTVTTVIGPPPVGNVLQVMTYPSATVGFNCMSLDLGGGLILQPQFNSTGLSLKVTTYTVGASQPQLFSSILPNGLFLQWPASYTGWVLESTTIISESVWPPVAGTCGNNVIAPETGSQQYFRLHNEN